MAQLCKVSTEDVETLSAMVKLAQEIDESARESEYCDFHVKRVLTGYGGGVEKDAVALDEEKGEIIIVELRSVHQFNDSIDNFVMCAVLSEQYVKSVEATRRRSNTEQIEALQSAMKPTGFQRWGPRRTVRSCSSTQ